MRKSTVMLVHNYYRLPGGEDSVFEQEAVLLEQMGHRVVRVTTTSNALPDRVGLGDALRACWNHGVYTRIRKQIRTTRPDVVHVHNLLPLLSPSVYVAAWREGVPVVQTVHNFRLVCPTATMFRDGRICELCPSRSSVLPAIWHRCYRGSRAATIGVAAAHLVQRRIGLSWNLVDCFVAPSAFVRDKLVAFGVDSSRIVVKPHHVHWEIPSAHPPRSYALYAGRLTVEKGVDTLLAAWRTANVTLPLRLIGRGPLAADSEVTAAGAQITWQDWKPPEELMRAMTGACFLIAPSRVPETFGLVIAEAFSCGTPVLASRRGSFVELVKHGVTGLLFDPDDPRDLVRQVDWMVQNPGAAARMGRACRAVAAAHFSSSASYAGLMEIYRAAATRRRLPTASAVSSGTAGDE